MYIIYLVRTKLWDFFWFLADGALICTNSYDFYNSILYIDRKICVFLLSRKKSNPIIFLIASIGVMFFTAGLIRFIIGPSDQSFNDGVRFIFTVREFKAITGLNEGFGLKTSQAITITTTIILCSLLFFFLNKTRTGKSMRAFSDNEELALLSGIDPNKVVLLTWIIAGGLATFAGVLYGLDKIYKPFIFLQMLLPIFSAAIVGGWEIHLEHLLAAILLPYQNFLLLLPTKES